MSTKKHHTSDEDIQYFEFEGTDGEKDLIFYSNDNPNAWMQIDEDYYIQRR